MWRKFGWPLKERIFYETEKEGRKASSNLLKLCLSFGGMFESSIADKMGKQQKEEVLK